MLTIVIILNKKNKKIYLVKDGEKFENKPMTAHEKET